MLSNFRFLIFISLLLFTYNVYSETITGKITDAKTGELLVGCTVYIEELNAGTTSGFDGSFNLKKVPTGSYTINLLEANKLLLFANLNI